MAWHELEQMENIDRKSIVNIFSIHEVEHFECLFYFGQINYEIYLFGFH